jgi:hypothetical protein
LGPVQRQINEVILPLITCMTSPGIKLFFEPTFYVVETHVLLFAFLHIRQNSGFPMEKEHSTQHG